MFLITAYLVVGILLAGLFIYALLFDVLDDSAVGKAAQNIRFRLYNIPVEYQIPVSLFMAVFISIFVFCWLPIFIWLEYRRITKKK